jgi:hypothetical protein
MATAGPWPPKVREEMHPEAQAEAEGAAENECRTEFDDTGVEHQMIRTTLIPRSNL